MRIFRYRSAKGKVDGVPARIAVMFADAALGKFVYSSPVSAESSAFVVLNKESCSAA